MSPSFLRPFVGGGDIVPPSSVSQDGGGVKTCSGEQCFGFKHQEDSINKYIGVSLGKQYHSVKQLCKSEKKLNKYLEYLMKQNKVLFSMANKKVSRKELCKIKKIRSKASKKYNSLTI